MRDKLEGMELRGAALMVFGWSDFGEHQPSGEHVHLHGRPPADDTHGGWCGSHRGHWDRVAPAIESDPAVAIPMLLEFCERHELAWRISSAPHRLGVTCVLWFKDRNKSPVFADGASIPEAIRRAIVEAGE